MSKHADLTPPLGWYGGPCKVVERIEDTVQQPALRSELSEKVERGVKLTNPEAAKVYTVEAEKGEGLFRQMRILPHAQYRMDQRAITVGDLRTFFRDFSRKINDWKSQRAWEYEHYLEALTRGEPIEWVDKRLGDLQVVFVARGPGVVDVVTAYFKGEPDPRPGTCGTHPLHLHTAREVEDLSPVRTLVKDPSPSKSDTGKPQGEDGKYPTQGLPAPWSRSKPTKGPTVLNVPGGSGSNSDGNLREDRVRTKGTPGEQSPIPEGPARISPVRRPGMTADFLREQRPPDMSSETKYDRANNHDEWTRRDRKRLEDISEYGSPNTGNPGSRVLPSGAGHFEKEAALIREIQEGCAPTLMAQGQKLVVKLRRVDAKNALWLFDVEGSKSEPYRIRLQAVRQGNIKALGKVHVRVSCSCPFWRWQGPEHWAKVGDYLYGQPVGLATKPDTKDPRGEHKACKHVLAVLKYVTDREWDVPEFRSRQAALRYLADTLDLNEDPWMSERVERLAVRYLASLEVPDA